MEYQWKEWKDVQVVCMHVLAYGKGRQGKARQAAGIVRCTVPMSMSMSMCISMRAYIGPFI